MYIHRKVLTAPLNSYLKNSEEFLGWWGLKQLGRHRKRILVFLKKLQINMTKRNSSTCCIHMYALRILSSVHTTRHACMTHSG
jgi:hypothetical protein